MQTRAQVTLFIVLGLVLLFVVGITIYIAYKSEVPEMGMPVESVPRAVEPLRNFILGCVQDVARQGLTVLGEQGGYTDLGGNGIFVNYINPTEGNAVEFTSVVPYWFYMSSKNDCRGTCYYAETPVVMKKELGDVSVERELEKYMQDNLEACLSGFEGFESYEIKNLSAPEYTVSVDELDVKFYVKMPLEVKAEGVTSTMSDFAYAAPLNFRKIFEKATEIKEAARQYCFLENFALFKVTEFSRAEAGKLPPISDVKFTTSGIYWLSDTVKKQFQTILEMYTPFMQVTGANNYRRVSVAANTKNFDLIQRSYDNMILPLDGSGYDIYFNYFSDWPIYFRTNHGAIIKPTSMYMPLINLGVQKYDTTYSFSYPVVVQIRDPEAFNNQGYEFHFGLEANVRNNECMESEFDPLTPNHVSSGSLMCEPDQRNSGMINITVKNQNRDPVPGVLVSFVSGEKCILGETDAKGVLATNFPIGIGAIEFENPDYLGYKYPYTTEVDTPDKFEINLLKKNTKAFVVMKKNIRKADGWRLNDIALPLSYSEQAIVMLERVNDDNMQDFDLAFSYSGNQTEKETIELPPGKYTMTINVMDSQKLYIPASTRKVKSGFKSKKITIPEVTLDAWQSGGLEFNENNGYWTVDPGALLASNEIRFYAIGIQREDMQIVEDLEQMGNVDVYSANYHTALKPEMIFR